MAQAIIKMMEDLLRKIKFLNLVYIYLNPVKCITSCGRLYFLPKLPATCYVSRARPRDSEVNVACKKYLQGFFKFYALVFHFKKNLDQCITPSGALARPKD